MAHARYRPRVNYTWEGISFSASNAAAGGAVVGLIVVAEAVTVARCRGELVASIDGPTDGDKVLLSYGIIVVTEEQLAVGLTAIPDPFLDMDAEWIWHGFTPLTAQSVVNQAATSEVARLTIDSKVMRKMKQGQNVAFVLRATSIAGTPATDVLGACRVLLRED